ncbi:hypothetical protein [Amycolatopsis sp. NPDC003731]
MLMLFGSLGWDWAPARGALVLSGVALLAGAVVFSGWVDWPALGRWARPLAVPPSLPLGWRSRWRGGGESGRHGPGRRG